MSLEKSCRPEASVTRLLVRNLVGILASFPRHKEVDGYFMHSSCLTLAVLGGSSVEGPCHLRPRTPSSLIPAPDPVLITPSGPVVKGVFLNKPFREGHIQLFGRLRSNETQLIFRDAGEGQNFGVR